MNQQGMSILPIAWVRTTLHVFHYFAVPEWTQCTSEKWRSWPYLPSAGRAGLGFPMGFSSCRRRRTPVSATGVVGMGLRQMRRAVMLSSACRFKATSTSFSLAMLASPYALSSSRARRTASSDSSTPNKPSDPMSRNSSSGCKASDLSSGSPLRPAGLHPVAPSKSPNARDTARNPPSLPPSISPPTETTRAASDELVAMLWSLVRGTAVPPRQSTARQSPAQARCTLSAMTRATSAVVPQQLPPSAKLDSLLTSPSHSQSAPSPVARPMRRALSRCSANKSASVLPNPSRRAVRASPSTNAAEPITLKWRRSLQNCAAKCPPWPSKTQPKAKSAPAGAWTTCASSMYPQHPRSDATPNFSRESRRERLGALMLNDRVRPEGCLSSTVDP
mmetsp:Transcript_5697/g.13993  ORF Transcript_5697/g.13993 Transcript_5697/m.13993 type:complete len:390 (-) Transcript_5697:351-1520(-)